MPIDSLPLLKSGGEAGDETAGADDEDNALLAVAHRGEERALAIFRELEALGERSLGVEKCDVVDRVVGVTFAVARSIVNLNKVDNQSRLRVLEELLGFFSELKRGCGGLRGSSGRL